MRTVCRLLAVALGAFAVAVASVLLTAPDQRRWLGWWAGAAGVGLILVRLVWTQQIWLLPYFAFYLWLATFSVLVLRGGPAARR